MEDYSSWKTKQIKVTNIRLDSKNPRIPVSTETLSQRDLIHHFVSNYKIYELAKSIAEDGYFPDERIVGIEEGDSFIVLEGNRRVTALKVLYNTDLVPEEMKKRFNNLVNEHGRTSIVKLEALIAPNRESATKLILEKHTQQSVLNWSTLMQAEFYYRMIEDGKTVDEISQLYNLTPSTIQRFLRMCKMHSLSTQLDLGDDIKRKVEDTQTFPITVLERIYESPEMRKHLTLSDDLNKISCQQAQFKDAYAKITTDVANGKETSRTLNKADDIKRYIGDLKKSVKITKIKSSTPIKSLFKGKGIAKRTALKSEAMTSPPKERSKSLPKGLFNATGVPFRIDGATSLRKFYIELRGLPVKTYPNTSAILMRVFVEKSCRHYLKRHKVKEIPIGKKRIKLADASFGELLDYLSKKSTTLISDDSIKKAIRTFKNSSDFKSLSSLNTIVHNEEVTFTEEQVRNLWPNVEGLTKLLLSDES